MVAVMLFTFIPNLAWAAQISSGNGTWISGKLTYTYVVDSEGSSENGATGSASVNGSTLTLKAVSSKASSGCSSTSAYSTTTTVTVKNASSYPLTVTTLTPSNVTVSGVSTGSTIAAGATFTISITANPNSTEDSSSRTATGTVTIAVQEQTEVYITAVSSPYTSYTLHGHTVQQNGTNVSFKVDINTNIALPTLANSEGYVFAGWRIGSKPITTATSFVADYSYSVFPVFLSEGSSMNADNFKVGNETFTFWDEAIGAAVNGSNKKVIVNRDVTLPSTLADNTLPESGGTYVKPDDNGGVNYILPSGVTLLVPFDESGTVYTSTPAVVYGSHTNPTAFRTLTMASGTSITVQNGGAICCSGKLSASGQMGGWNGTPTGPDGRINMLGGSNITLESGANLYCWGYIYGAGSVEAKSGSTVYEAFQIKDWRGGTATSNVYKYAFIFNQYYIQNIEVPLTICAGANEKLYSSVNASSSAYPMSATFIGSGGMFSINSGYIVKDYQEQTDRLNIEVSGNVSVSPMTLSGLPVIGSITTADYILPITSNISIDLKSGTSTVTQDIELLPGVEVMVGSGAEFKINSGKKVYLYDNENWGNFSGSTKMYPIGYSVANGTTAVRSAASLKDAVLDVNGTVTVAGSLFTSNEGGHITSSEGTQDGKGKIVFSTAPAASSTIYEMEGNSTKTAVVFTAPKLHNGDDSYSATAGSGTSTWFYDKDGEHWYRYLVSFVYNGKTVGSGYFCENGSTVTYDASWLTGLGASVSSGSATASVSGTNVNVTNVTANSVVTLTGTSASFVPTFVLNEKQYQNYRIFTGNTITETREINGETYYVVKKAAAAMAVGTEYAAPTDQEMGVSSNNHNDIVWNLSGQSATSGNLYNGFVPVGETSGGPAYIFGFYTGAVAYNSFTDQYYATLADAMADVPQYGTGTVRLIADCGSFEDESGTAAYPILEATNLTIDLNGHRAVGRLINKGTMTLEMNGGTWDYHTGATAPAAAYQAAAAVTNSGTLRIQDSTGGGRILADAISNAGVPNHAAVIRNFSGGTISISNVTLENTQDVNGYTSVIMNDRATITSLENVTILSPRGYAIWNHGGHIGTIDSCTVDAAYGIYNRNVRGANAFASGYNISNYGIIDLIKDSTVTAGQYAIHNNAVITELNNCTFTAHPDSAQVNTVGTAAANVQGNVQCYTVFNNNAWWYDSAVWKRTDSGLTRTDDYKEDEAFRPTIGTITDCRIYAENTSTSADHGCALYNNGGVIGTIGGTTEIKTYKHPSNAKSIASNYALRNTAGGVIKNITGTVTISASGYSAVYNDGQFTAKTVNTYADKIGGVQLHNVTTYGEPSTIGSINAGGSITAGSYYGIYTNGYIGNIGGGLTISANYNALLNSGAGSLASYDFVRSYTSNTDASTETKRVETYVRNLDKGGVIDYINGVSLVGTGSNSYQLLQNQGYIGTLANVSMSAATPRAGENYPMMLNGDSRQSGHTLTREPYAYESLYITPYEYHYEYSLAPTIDVMDNVTITKNATFAVRNLGHINTLKNSTITGTQYVLVNAANGPYTERDSIRYYSGATKFAATKNNGSELTYACGRTAAEIGEIDNCSITGTSTNTVYNGGHLGTLTNNTISSTNTTVVFNGGASVRAYDYNLKDIVSVAATDSACTVTYGANNETRIITTDYEAPVIDLIGEGNKINGTYQVLVNLGTITAIDGGSNPVEITATTQKQIGGIYSYNGTLGRRVATTPYTAGTAGTAVNEDTYLSAYIGSIKNTVITANGIGIQNGAASASYLPVIDELGEGLEINANCTTAGYHAVYNTAYAKITEISGGVYTAAKATTNAYKNNNTNPEHATLISGGDFKGAASTRANAIFEPDNTNRQTYPEGKNLVGTESAALHNGTTADGYYFIGTAYTVTWRIDDSGDPLEVDEAVTAGTIPSYDGAAPTKADDDNYTYTFAGWATAPNQETGTPADQLPAVTANVTYYAAFGKEEKGKFTVTWLNEDGTELEKDEKVAAGAKPSYDGAAPTKAATEDYTFTFAGWKIQGGDTVYTTETLPAISADTTFVAAYTQITREYHEPTWTWTGTTAASATFTAKDDAGYKKTVAASLSSATTPATCTEAGKTVYTATVSFHGKTYTDSKETEIQALGHAWGEPVWSWTGYETATATFTCANDQSHVEAVTAEITSAVVAATCEEAGSTVYTATVTFNGETYTDTKTETIPALGHTPGEPVTENEVTATCLTDGSYDEVVYCTACGEELSRETKTVPALGHDWDAPAYEWAADNSTVTATRVCQNDPSHVETETAETTSEITKAATCEAKGETTYTATFTNAAFATQTRTVANIDALGHTPGEVVIENEVAATCETAGSYDEVIYCTVCGEELSRETMIIPALGHDWNVPAYEWAEDNSTVTATRVCENDPSHIETETVNTTSEVTKAATCEAKGETIFVATFENAAFATQTKTVETEPLGHDWSAPSYTWAEDNSTVTANRVCRHDAGHVEEETVETVCEISDATCTEPGTATYTAVFTMAVFEMQTKTIETQPALGHDWGDVSYLWAEDYTTVTATRVCGHDASHVETETAEATELIVKAPTCEESGETIYSASFTSAAFEDQSMTVETDPLGHDWSEPTWSWDGYNAATASFTCQNDESHTVTLDADISREDYPAECETDGMVIYTATAVLDGLEYTDSRTVTLPATGHRYEEPEYLWIETDDGYYVSAMLVCRNNPDHVISEGVDATYEVITEPTERENGLARYTAVFENEVFTTQTKDIILPKFGPDGYWITIEDYTNGGAAHTLDLEELYRGETGFEVSADKAVLVAIRRGESYELVSCSTDEDGRHIFQINVEEDTVIVFAYKGDVNLDGEVKAMDGTMTKRLALGTFEVDSELSRLTADVNGDGKVQALDGTVISRVVLGTFEIGW